MNRPRHFDIDELRERVADVFIAHGYRGTSMSMLSEASGLGRQSLYNALGDKEAAYLQSIDCAVERNRALAAVMAEAPDGRQAVHRFFDKVIEVSACADRSRNACIVTTGLADGADSDAIAEKLQEKWRELGSLLQDTIERGQRDGSVRADVASEVLGGLLMTLFVGIRVTARARSGRAELETHARWVLKLIDPGSPLP